MQTHFEGAPARVAQDQAAGALAPHARLGHAAVAAHVARPRRAARGGRRRRRAAALALAAVDFAVAAIFAATTAIPSAGGGGGGVALVSSVPRLVSTVAALDAALVSGARPRDQRREVDRQRAVVVDEQRRRGVDAGKQRAAADGREQRRGQVGGGEAAAVEAGQQLGGARGGRGAGLCRTRGVVMAVGWEGVREVSAF